MRGFILWAAFMVAIVGGTISASAQTRQAAAPTGFSLYRGLTMKAEQQCPRYPGQGVTISVESVGQLGTSGNISVQVSCWGSWALLHGGKYTGSIAIEGNNVRLRFFLGWDTKFGAELSGTLQTDGAGKAQLVFKQGVLRAERPVHTDELLFR